MRRHNHLLAIVALMLAIVSPSVLGSCGSVRGHWGIDGDYGLSLDGHNHFYESKDDKHKKPKKHKKKHHHHHDDDAAFDESFEVPL